MSREAIVARAKYLCDSIASENGVLRVLRNYAIPDAGMPSELLPAIVIVDGNEENTGVAYGNKRPASAPQIILLHMEILVSAIAPYEAIGGQLNSISLAIINALRGDGTFVALTFEGEGARYMGMEMGLAQADDTVGYHKLNFDIRYKL
jgi:hypothetical protein